MRCLLRKFFIDHDREREFRLEVDIHRPVAGDHLQIKPGDSSEIVESVTLLGYSLPSTTRDLTFVGALVSLGEAPLAMLDRYQAEGWTEVAP